MSTDEVMFVASKAARSGMYVFPCEPGGKRPVVIGNGSRMDWGRQATTDEMQIEDWWTRCCPDANYGIACKYSRLLVIDCDMPKEGKEIPAYYRRPGVNIGEDIWCTIVAEVAGVGAGADIMDTLTVWTPSGGMHYYFSNLNDFPLRNSSLVPSWVDVRGNGGEHGGYVVGPGSSGPGNSSYRVANRAPIKPAPEWLLALCTAPTPTSQPPVRRTSAARTPYDPRTKNLTGLVDTVLRAPVGDRNNKLMWSACKYAEEGMPIAQAHMDLGDAAKHIGLGDEEIHQTIRSAYRKVGR